MRSFDVTINGERHEIVYIVQKLKGGVTLRIDGERKVYTGVFAKQSQIFYYAFKIDETELVLKVNKHGKAEDLAVDGVYIESSLPVEFETLDAANAPVTQKVVAEQQQAKHLRSFLSAVLLTYANILILLASLDIYFPFSAFAPSLALSIFRGAAAEASSSFPLTAIGAVVALLMTSVYLALYLIADKKQRSVVPVWFALIFFIIDTVMVLILAFDNPLSMVLDLVFHAWVIWSLAKLIHTRKKLEKIQDAPAEANQ